MLELIYGPDWVANSEYMMKLLSEDIANEQGNRLLLVPELISHDTERQLCQVAGDTACRFAEVISFSKLTRMVAEQVDDTVPACMDQGGRVIAMAAAARQLHGSLKAFASVETKPEFLLTMVDAVDDFKRCCISGRDLEIAAENTQGELAQKLSEIALLLQTYDAICAQGKRDPSDLLNWVLQELEDSDFAENHVLYVDGFPDLTQQHYLILEHFIRNSPKVVVCLNCDRIKSELLAFEKAGETADRLVKAAEQCGVVVKQTFVQPRTDLLTPLRQKIFQGETKIYPQLGDVVSLKTADSIYHECRQAAEDILNKVQNGARYRDFSLVCTDMGSYKSVLSYVLNRMNIPYYLAGTDPVLENSAMGTLCAALDAVTDGMEQKSVLRYLRSALSPLDADTCDLVENYAFVWRVNGKAWLEPWDKHPDGLDGRWNDHVMQTVGKIEAARSKSMAPLEKLRDGIRGASNLAQQVDSVIRFLDDIRFCDRLEEMSAMLDEQGDNRSAQILNQLWNIMVDALEQLKDVLGNTIWDEKAFVKLFYLLLGQYDVGTIPTVLDAVSIGNVSAMRCQRPVHLLLIGCAEGSLPGYSGSTGIFSDKERDEIRKLSVPLTGGAIEGIQAEFAELYGVFCGVKETVSLYCGKSQPSYIFERVKKLVPAADHENDPIIPANAYEAALYLNEKDDLDAARELGIEAEFEDVSKRKKYTLGKVSLENIQRLYGRKMRVSATQVEKHALCKLAYFLQYGLNVKQMKVAEVDPSSFGTFIHYVLENTVRDVIDEGGFHHEKASLSRTLDIAGMYARKYYNENFEQLDSASTQYLMERNMAEMDLLVTDIWNELSNSKYEPIACEVNIDKIEGVPLMEFGDQRLRGVLVGKVDRLDRYQEGEKNYFRIVDYKSSQKKLDYCDMYNDIGLQMLIYLVAMDENGENLIGDNRIPGGVLYCTAKVGFIKLKGAEENEDLTRKKNKVRNGMILNDDLSIEAMDPQEGHPLLHCPVKDGQYGGDVISGEQMDLMKAHVHLALERMVDDVASGDVNPNPYFRGTNEKACGYCPYMFICHRNETANIRNYMTVKADKFWEDVENEVKRSGR